MNATLSRPDIVSDGEIISQLQEMQVMLPRAGDLARSIKDQKLSTKDALYFLLLDSLELRRRASRHRALGDRPSQALPSVGD